MTDDADKPAPGTFVWWGRDGTRHEAPIVYYRVPEGVQLRYHDRCGECDSQGRPTPHLDLPEEDILRALERSGKVMVPRNLRK